nr:hypothetical protein [Tanacetum cinerariifolium]GFA73709.1 hypothetical protein [Tanacetum cinerariifolium]
MKTVFNISNYPLKYQVKYASCTLLNSALTWWNSHKRTIRVDAVYGMKWAELMKLMTEQLILLCTRMVPDEEDRVERFIGGLPDNIQGNGYARNAENKRKFDNCGQQPSSFKRHNVSGPCMVKCGNCRRVGHMTRDIMYFVVPNTQMALVGNQSGVIYYECGRPVHYKKDCPKLKNQNHRNKTRNKIGTNRSFVSSTFSTLLDVAPSTLDTSYAVELADGRISETNVILRGCTLGLLGHPLNNDLMSVELGSFDVIISMDWLEKYHAVIFCDEKIVRIPYGYEVLIIRGNDCDSESKSKLSIISCTKTQKYIPKGCQVYLMQVTSKKSDDKSEEKRLEDVPIMR